MFKKLQYVSLLFMSASIVTGYAAAPEWEAIDAEIGYLYLQESQNPIILSDSFNYNVSIIADPAFVQEHGHEISREAKCIIQGVLRRFLDWVEPARRAQLHLRHELEAGSITHFKQILDIVDHAVNKGIDSQVTFLTDDSSDVVLLKFLTREVAAVIQCYYVTVFTHLHTRFDSLVVTDQMAQDMIRWINEVPDSEQQIVELKELLCSSDFDQLFDLGELLLKDPQFYNAVIHSLQHRERFAYQSQTLLAFTLASLSLKLRMDTILDSIPKVARV